MIVNKEKVIEELEKEIEQYINIYNCFLNRYLSTDDEYLKDTSFSAMKKYIKIAGHAIETKQYILKSLN